ncbi:uncharacterized protein MONBRDRAFT_34674 [Monosiga brevicollis MX1]|uniref:Sulfotransferase domain-containing protein n=1 Tax=Monosiga brevicollis TaxID=81824 RepID=A9VD96_MONBE|nr:uncharacterized protein MONBRDRAFT_34674 [Monosiga brevicollis MX1]EDQ84490.1 predicted protein [Monosiga brevicollis MX1]|eukprot:XP_001750677.1 hypothetical protein [Monosiga brevicollis MX1]
MSTPRLIIITRNPKDTAVSLFHHMRNKKSFDFEGTWDDFFAMMKQETVESSNFFKWHAPYWKAYREGRINALWLHYEWVTEHLEEAVAKVAAFVDKDLPSETVKKIASACTLDSMKANPKADCSWISGKQGDAKHLRKGGKGGWMDVFTNEQNQEMNGWIQTWATLMPDLDWDYGV